MQCTYPELLWGSKGLRR